jgi:UrcA family protein
MALTIFLSPIAGAATDLPRGYEPVTRTVNFADLDLTNTRGVATLYQRIKTAADKVCEFNGSRAYETMLVHVHRCTKQAIAQAVRDVNCAELTSLHLAAISPPDFP